MLATRLEIIAEMDRIISDESLSRLEKAKRLTDLSERYWQEVFPERGTEAYDQLTVSEQSARMARVQDEEEQFFQTTVNPNQILKALAWPAKGCVF